MSKAIDNIQRHRSRWAYLEIVPGPLGLGTPVFVCWYLYLTHCIFFNPEFHKSKLLVLTKVRFGGLNSFCEKHKISKFRFASFGIFQVSLLSKASTMFEFDQYLGFLAFLTIVTIGFWLMMFLLLFVVPYWLGGNLMEIFKERREARRAKRNT
jgi:hypothetical protein